MFTRRPGLDRAGSRLQGFARSAALIERSAAEKPVANKGISSKLLTASKWLGAAIAAFVGVVVLLTAFATYDLLTTKAEKLAELLSPDGSYEVWIVLQKSIMDKETTVMVRDRAEAARSGSRSWHAVVTFDGMWREPNIRVSWQDQRTLLIEYYPYMRNDSIHSSEGPFKDVKVVMQKMQVTPTPR